MHEGMTRRKRTNPKELDGQKQRQRDKERERQNNNNRDRDREKYSTYLKTERNIEIEATRRQR
jgi:hypothetical protein